MLHFSSWYCVICLPLDNYPNPSLWNLHQRSCFNPHLPPLSPLLLAACTQQEGSSQKPRMSSQTRDSALLFLLLAPQP